MFKPVDPKQNFPSQEEEILKFWKKNNIFKKSLTKKSPKGNFVFYEGPPTANGKPGLHHVLARAFKDLIPRYKTMNGYYVERKAGWDTHGLPVELEVEKKLNISGKPEIEKYGIEEFNKNCKESVWFYKTEWERLTSRIAYWVDLEHPYITYENNYIESLWWIVKKIWDKDLLYLGHKVVPHCPRCGTALSSHEVAQGYKKIQENSVYIKFALPEEKNTYILAWTTTPWTLPGNVALAIGKNIKYVKVRQGDEYYILAENLLKVLNGKYEIIKEYKAEELEGKEYTPLFDFVNLGKTTGKKAYYLTLADFVTTDDGTGVVHTAVMYGEDDYTLGDKIDLPKFHTVDENGKFIDMVKPWAGQFVKDAEKSIISYLKEHDILYKVEQVSHEYPFCWRCGTPLLYYAKNSWFIKMSKLKSELVKNNKDINWVPAYIKDGRFGEWLKDVKDWAVSRERYWGTPLPIWQCETCKKYTCIGSVKELEEKNSTNFKSDMDLHRPYIDKVKFKCDCGKEMKRVSVVMDCWFDSGAMPFAQSHYPFENPDMIDKKINFPADYISEAIDQTRGWFYTLLAISTLLEKGSPYKNVICLGHILDAKGQKMSKSRGNVIDPWEVLGTLGADALRFHLYTMNQPGDVKRFDLNGVTETLRKNILLLWNVYSYFVSYATLDEFEKSKANKLNSKFILDKWILARFDNLNKDVTKSLNDYDIFHASRLITSFIDDLSTWYLRRSRKRHDDDFYLTLYTVLFNFAKIIAPFMPFVSEAMYQNLKTNSDPESVHLCDWPSQKSGLSVNDSKEIIEQMQEARDIVEKVLALRAEKGIKVRQPLSKLKIQNSKFKNNDFLNIIAEEINVKEVVVDSKINEEIELDTKITPELRMEGLLRETIRQIQSIRKKIGLTPSDKIVLTYHTVDKELNKVFEKFAKNISEETKLKKLESRKIENMTELKVENRPILISVVK